MAAQCGLVSGNARKMADDPAFSKQVEKDNKKRMAFTAEACKNGPPDWKTRYVPIVLHDIHSANDERLDEARIYDQITILNEMCNPEHVPYDVPKQFEDRVGYLDIVFELANDGVWDRPTDIAVFEEDDPRIMEEIGGGPVYKPDEFLNVYVCNLPASLLGSAQYPRDAAQHPEHDAIIVNRNAFGLEGDLYADNRLGKTLVHEVGHYLGLPHIWGESDGKKWPHRCDDGDFVCDTPNQFGPNGYRVKHPHRSKKCPGSTEPDMFMNFMDIGPDEQLHMFTNGQVAWMQEQMRQYRPLLGVV